MIAIVDYGLGNINAFANILKRLEIPYYFARTDDELAKATKIILPGVGAFDYAISKLNASGMREVLDKKVLGEKVPVIGICVGMQIMADSSEEGKLPGLGWISGEVKKIQSLGGEDMRLPHMGWNNILIKSPDVLVEHLGPEPRFYFLHSYYFQPKLRSAVVATASYGIEFACIIKQGNIVGIQCHPEKSHHDGMTVLKNFGRI